MSLKGKLAIFRDLVPLLIGRYPDRIAPTHIVNNLLVSAFGEGSRAASVREIIKGHEAIDIEEISESILSNDHKVQELRQAAAVILNPDRRVFPTKGSPFPLHLGLVNRDLSDEGFGGALWRLLCAADSKCRTKLQSLVGSKGMDAVSACGEVLGGGAILAPAKKTNDSSWPWFQDGGQLGREFSKSLASLVLSACVDQSPRTRSARLVALTRNSFAAVFLGAARSAELIAKKPAGWGELAPMFVFGGLPPGVTGGLEVRLASRCFERVADAQRAALRMVIRERLELKRSSVRIPKEQRARVLLGTTFPEAKREVVDELVASIGAAQTPEQIAEAIVDGLYPSGYLESGLRQMGRKIGLTGPDRGYGSPRFVLETPALSMLVEATLLGSVNNLLFEDWIDVVYERFGMILGRGKKLEPVALLKDLESEGPLSRAVELNQEQLRRRLIRAGLAVEYSDGETEVLRTEEVAA